METRIPFDEYSQLGTIIEQKLERAELFDQTAQIVRLFLMTHKVFLWKMGHEYMITQDNEDEGSYFPTYPQAVAHALELISQKIEGTK